MTTPAERLTLAARVARNLKREREKADMTVYELSARSDVNRRAVVATEQGRRLPRLGTAQKLANGLGIEADKLIVGIEWRPPPEGAFFVDGKRVGG